MIEQIRSFEIVFKISKARVYFWRFFRIQIVSLQFIARNQAMTSREEVKADELSILGRRSSETSCQIPYIDSKNFGLCADDVVRFMVFERLIKWTLCVNQETVVSTGCLNVLWLKMSIGVRLHDEFGNGGWTNAVFLCKVRTLAWA